VHHASGKLSAAEQKELIGARENPEMARHGQTAYRYAQRFFPFSHKSRVRFVTSARGSSS